MVDRLVEEVIILDECVLQCCLSVESGSD